MEEPPPPPPPPPPRRIKKHWDTNPGAYVVKKHMDRAMSSTRQLAKPARAQIREIFNSCMRNLSVHIGVVRRQSRVKTLTDEQLIRAIALAFANSPNIAQTLIHKVKT